MQYGLTRRVLNCKHLLPIERGEFDEIREAKDRVFAALGMEEKHDMLLQTYVEYEHELLQVTIANALFRFPAWSEFREVSTQINRRLVHLMSVGRLYLDHIRHDAGPLFRAKDGSADTLDSLMSAQYDARLGYRVLEALRNYVQHRGLPLHSLSLGGGWVETDEGPRRKEKTTLYLNVGLLAKDRKFKRTVIRELKGGEDRLPIKPLVREYVTGIMRIQKGLREELKDVVEEADNVLTSAIQRFRREAEEEVVGLAAVALKSDGTHDRHVEIFRSPMDRRRELESKNRGAGDLEKLIVTSE